MQTFTTTSNLLSETFLLYFYPPFPKCFLFYFVQHVILFFLSLFFLQFFFLKSIRAYWLIFLYSYAYNCLKLKMFDQHCSYLFSNPCFSFHLSISGKSNNNLSELFFIYPKTFLYLNFSRHQSESTFHLLKGIILATFHFIINMLSTKHKIHFLSTQADFSNL